MVSQWGQVCGPYLPLAFETLGTALFNRQATLGTALSDADKRSPA